MILNNCVIGNSTRISWRVFDALIRQCRHNELWATKRKKKTSVDTAIEYFDTVYGPLFEKRWPSIRLALLSPHKYCAVVNNYNEPDKTCTELENIGAINIREMFRVREDSLLEKNSIRKRKSDMNRIYNLDKKIEKIAARKHEEELQNLYPEGQDYQQTLGGDDFSNKEESLDKKELIAKAKSSLEKSLSEASIDTDRQIDPSEGLSSTRLNDFVPTSRLKGNEKFVSESEHFAFYNDTREFPVTVEPETELSFPPHLQIYTFNHGDLSEFRPPKSGASGLLDYYLMDAASFLPVLALGLEPGDHVLDMCAAPGGKSLLCLQTLYPDSVYCNDASLSRLNRLKFVIRQYFGELDAKVTINHEDGQNIFENGKFTKILVDVPCTTDRHSATEVDNNIFKPSRNRERILLPQTQVDLLFHALKLVDEGGCVVYSTCCLNPAQNDGVVQMALRRIWEETNMKIVVKDLSAALEPAKVVFRFADANCLRYGSLVVPYLPSNFGPMYFCKLEKKSNN
ncbi:5-methylcytosine rRNA methyltransferase NSUN4-like [Macrosteles quadrilineatus]|uniref:5-methylcytosine rRNA methyltransferase NSUN4-like n=1 Tax=Macrosteles quadrilineatus TaxID=74068 RepID=UPI0023E2F813|nr:5-methylcytosine rRNA methyltransferase NSUN4-like [Macrosteles quadrilineatus]